MPYGTPKSSASRATPRHLRGASAKRVANSEIQRNESRVSATRSILSQQDTDVHTKNDQAALSRDVSRWIPELATRFALEDDEIERYWAL
jgi:ubiquitin